MRALIGCEFSGVVRDAFHKQGWEAWSCDLLPTEIEGNHFEGDIFEALSFGRWDVVILFPPCTCLCLSGNRWYGKGMPNYTKRLEAASWTRDLWNKARSVCNHVALENPMGVLPKLVKMEYSQRIQPYEYGHAEQKTTCLWLHNLPCLEPTNNVREEMQRLPMKEQQRVHRLPPSADRWKQRSKTYQGVADAMAFQWTQFIAN